MAQVESAVGYLMGKGAGEGSGSSARDAACLGSGLWIGGITFLLDYKVTTIFDRLCINALIL